MGKKKNKHKNSGQVIIPAGHPSPPEPHEVDAALVLASHYQSTIEFLVPVDDYKRKSADIVMLGIEWEIKSPIGKSKYTIQEQFRRASKQAQHIIIDTRRTKLEYANIEKSVLVEIKKRPYIKKVILIDKFEKVIEINI
jgi:predicted phage-related endonuclease